MIVAIHQPEYMPWLGLLDKARRADVLVLLDDVQFNRASLQHRAKIASPRGPFAWLTIPFVHCFPQLIRDVRQSSQEWRTKHIEMLRASYAKAPGATAALDRLTDFYGTKYDTVASAARCSMIVLAGAFGVRMNTMVSSSLEAQGERGDRVLDICKRVKATKYLSGQTGAAYLDREAFAQAGIAIEVQSFEMPRYREGQPDVPGLSALDAWMHLGDKAKELF